MVHKCINCGHPMTAYYSRDGSIIFMCPNVRITIKREKLVTYGLLFCNMVKTHKGKNIKLFKEQLKSKLVKIPLPKEDYKRIEKEIKKLEQADVNDILYTSK